MPLCVGGQARPLAPRGLTHGGGCISPYYGRWPRPSNLSDLFGLSVEHCVLHLSIPHGPVIPCHKAGSLASLCAWSACILACMHASS